MFLGELMRVPVVQFPLGVDEVELAGHAHDGAARVPVRQLVVLVPEVVEVLVYRVRQVQLSKYSFMTRPFSEVL
jgi:hypothetical protein